MMRIGIGVLVSISLVSGAAQAPSVEPPLNLDLLVKIISDPTMVGALGVPAITKEIQNRGIDFDAENHLTQILRAGLNGKREPAEMAALVLACLRSCQECRARYLTPMTKNDLLLEKQWRFTPEAIFDEAKVRRVSDIEISGPAAKELRDAGFSEKLVGLLVPDDKLPVSTPEGYKP